MSDNVYSFFWGGRLILLMFLMFWFPAVPLEEGWELCSENEKWRQIVNCKCTNRATNRNRITREQFFQTVHNSPPAEMWAHGVSVGRRDLTLLLVTALLSLPSTGSAASPGRASNPSRRSPSAADSWSDYKGYK